ncbi:MAG: DUF4265 domain-containing protein [Steroidobacter sp.]
MSELLFVLNIEDDWPPVAKEGLSCTVCKGGYRVDVPPFFIKDLSVGDVVTVQRNEMGDVVSWSHVRKSKRSTVWIMVAGDHSIEDVIDCLKRLRCNIERFTQYRYFAVDVPEECPAISLDECLDFLDKRAHVVFPSFRH